MIQLNKVHYPYQQQTMVFDFTVDAGERVAILGPSGAGKSTLLSLIAGFQFARSGTIRLNGDDHTSTPPAMRPVSMLFQENNLFAHLTAAQNIALGFHPGMKLNTKQKTELAQIAEQVSLTPLLSRLPSQLSGGQRQRVALARCLVRSQPILLLDEPFSALDPALRNEMLALLETICETRQLTLLMVSHNPDDAARIASRAMVVDDGHIAYDGSTAALVSGEVPAASILGIRK